MPSVRYYNQLLHQQINHQYLFSLEKSDVDINIPAMDINGDGETNVKDLIRLAQYLAGWDIKLN